MINFCMNLRTCICFNTWGVWMGLQDHQQHLGKSLLPDDYLNDSCVYVALRTQSNGVYRMDFRGKLGECGTANTATSSLMPVTTLTSRTWNCLLRGSTSQERCAHPRLHHFYAIYVLLRAHHILRQDTSVFTTPFCRRGLRTYMRVWTTKSHRSSIVTSWVNGRCFFW